ncbi:hypothetical protein [Sphingomonas sp.]|uniref:hypothetical protein n=1 Tax=Sphingomonas sp. TaxID=28214 RepID=UPI002E31EEC8|nr:hypothetical protein [Sphingomonas sp.]HEX4694524.1 hypothetical protein [Sphingomonas sp.]
MLDFVWKSVWMIAFGLPMWRAGLLTPDTAETLRATALGVVLMPLVLPWGYVARRYLIARGDRWTAAV